MNIIDTVYQLLPEHETIAIARDYRIVKDEKSGKYYVLKGS